MNLKILKRFNLYWSIGVLRCTNVRRERIFNASLAILFKRVNDFTIGESSFLGKYILIILIIIIGKRY
uniref:Uncharacterized protein n=1 Tax=Rhodnius prolixus TaxID=13249 RepID=T1I646_RHOPR